MLTVEIADTPSKQAHGLMFRRLIPDDQGMIFIFKKPDQLKFWGVNTFLPLDIAYVNQHNRIAQISRISPLSEKSVISSVPCHIAIEANLGFFEKSNIKVGDTIEFKRQGNTGNVRFVKDEKTSKIAQFLQERESVKPKIELTGQTPQISPDSVQQQIQQMQPGIPSEQNPQGLPVIGPSELGKILEDSYDDQEQNGPEQSPFEQNMDNGLPPVPEVSFEGQEEEEEPEKFDIPDKEYPDFGSPQQALIWAQQNKEVVRIWYTTKSGRDIEREVEPHGQFVAESTGNPIAVTFDETIGDVRAFITNKILYHSFVGKQFQPKFVVAP